MIKKTLFFTLILIFFNSLIVHATTDISNNEAVTDIINEIDFSDIDTFTLGLNLDQKKSFSYYVRGIIEGTEDLEFDEVLNILINKFFIEVRTSIVLMVNIFIILVLTAILKNMVPKEEGTVSQIAVYVCYITMIGILLNNFIIIIDVAKSAIDNTVLFMNLLIPILIVTLAMLGKITTTVMLGVASMGSIAIIVHIIKLFVYPCLFISSVISLISGLNNKIKLDSLAKFLRNTAIAVCGVLFSIFLTISSLKVVSTTSIDNLTLNVTKTSVGKFIPVVGNYVEGGMDIFFSSALLIKNSVGITGIVVLLLLTLIPVLKIASIGLAIKVTQVISEPLFEHEIIKKLGFISSTILTIAGVVLLISIMFIFYIGIIIKISV